jgi:SNF2 family DNA or RNA helicase
LTAALRRGSVDLSAGKKLVEFRELVSNLVLTQKRKVVVFSQFRRMLELASWSVSDLLSAVGCITLELPWNPAVLEQRIGRIHRLGQKRPIDVYNLVSRACIEERIAGLVAGKRALFKGLCAAAA